MSEKTRHLYAFGPFHLDAKERLLILDGKPVPLAHKAFEALLMLVENAGRLVDKDDLMRRLWPDTFVEEANVAKHVSLLRKVLSEATNGREYIETIPKRGYRFVVDVTEVVSTALEKDRETRYQSASDMRADLQRLKRDSELTQSPATTTTAETGRGVRGVVGNRWKVLVPGALAVAALAVGAYFYFHRVPVLTNKDLIVLADFTDTTGDAVFDDTLKQALAIQLEQSPFLTLVSEQRIQQTLRQMRQPPDARLTPEIARELCQRTTSAAVLNGSIANLGSQYVLGIKVLNCRTGETLAQEQLTANGKERVLKAIGEAAAQVRGKLGESLSTVQKFDTPVEQATTPSLEALQAYSMGRKTMTQKSDFSAAVAFFQRATSLDSNFAMAYSSLGNAYWSLGEKNLGAENARKAYELRERVSDREKFYIECNYQWAAGDLEKARQAYELWAQTYPRDDVPRGYLGVIYGQLGQPDKTLVEMREALRLDPTSGLNYAHLVDSYLSLNRLKEAQATAKEMQAKSLDSPNLSFTLYALAFLQNDAEGMAQQVAWSAGKPGVEDALLGAEADTAAYLGLLGKAREFSRRAVASAEHAHEQETAASDEAEAALREALFGNTAEATQRAAAAIGLSAGRDVEYGAALALALAGDADRAHALAEDLTMRFPVDTVVRFNYLPTILAQLALTRNNSSVAIETLQAATPYELGQQNGSIMSALNPVYVRGEAYLAARHGSEAAAEFQKLLDHRGIVLNAPIGALARLGLARAYSFSRDAAKRRNAYQDFLTLWKDADPDIPILKEAKAEYAKLK